MKLILRRLFKITKEMLLQFGFNFNLSRVTSRSDVLELLDKLNPVELDIELVRVGSSDDGGYLLPDDFDDIEALFSPGVGSKSDLELEFATRGVEVFMADASVDAPCHNHKLFNFDKKFIASFDSGIYMSMGEWVKKAELREGSDLILQMDIEGAEYETIYSMSKELLERFRIIVVEFHGLDKLWDKILFTNFSHAFYKLLETHRVVHIHPNNCCEVYRYKDIEIPKVMEFTFVRRDRGRVMGFVKSFPNPLDSICVKGKKDIILPRCWYKG